MKKKSIISQSLQVKFSKRPPHFSCHCVCINTYIFLRVNCETNDLIGNVGITFFAIANIYVRNSWYKLMLWSCKYWCLVYSGKLLLKDVNQYEVKTFSLQKDAFNFVSTEGGLAISSSNNIRQFSIYRHFVHAQGMGGWQGRAL